VKYRVTVAELAAGGDGVAICTHQGERRAVFVPGVLVGEDVEIEADFTTRPARARVLDVVSPSPDRRTAPCPHTDRCGGCNWMHMTPDAQMRGHAAIVTSSLPAAFSRALVRSHPAEAAFGYRTRARMHAICKHGKTVVGTYGRRTREPVEIDTCIIHDPILEPVRRTLGHWLAGSRGEGEVQLSLGSIAEGRRAVIDLRFHGELAPEVFARLERAVLSGEIAGARVFNGEVKVPATIGDPTPWIVGPDGESLRVAPGGFSQATELGNVLLARRAADLAIELTPNRDATVLELYAGAGNLTVLLARERRVVAVESDRDACAAARRNLEARGLAAKVVEADAATYAIPSGTKLLVLDPPRTGAKDVVHALLRKPVAAVVYVSCDPKTLGRDLAILAGGGYELRVLETFEMFPQTSHVETIAALVRTSKSMKR